LRAGHGVVHAQGLAAAEVGGAALRIHHGHLPVLAPGFGGHRLGQGGFGRHLLGQAAQHLRAQGRQGDVLGGDGAHPGLQPGAARAHGDAGGADGHAQLAGAGAAPDDGEGHGKGPRWIRLGAAPSRPG
jgi:hypothetical protein